MIGLDVGGANLKISDGERTRSVSFPLWQQPAELSAAVGGLLRRFDPHSPVGLTMTGELADCFSSKAEGVHRILDAVCEAATGRPVFVWQTGGEFVEPDVARELVPLVAAANWHALATWAGRATPAGPSLLIDMGSTTTDIIPIADGLPCSRGLTDRERLAARELVYLGAGRTPVCAVVSELPFRGEMIPVAREVFATLLDVELLRGRRAEHPDDTSTADGRPATLACARQRLARMVCADANDFNAEQLDEFARHIETAAVELIRASLEQVVSRLTPAGERIETLIVAGSGSALAQLAIARVPALDGVNQLRLDRLIGPENSAGACAYAVARLLGERV